MRNMARHPLRAAASVCGIGLAVAVLMVGLVIIDVMDRLIATQFWVAERQDVDAHIRRAALGRGAACAGAPAGRDRSRDAARVSPCASAPAIVNGICR